MFLQISILVVSREHREAFTIIHGLASVTRSKLVKSTMDHRGRTVAECRNYIMAEDCALAVEIGMLLDWEPD